MSHRFGPRTRMLGTALDSRVSQWAQRSIIKSIQRGTISITGTTTNTATITAVVMANSVLRYLGSTIDAAGTDDKAFLRLSFANSTTIQATVATSPGAATAVGSFEVTEYWPGVIKSVQRGTITNGATATITAVNTAKSELHYLGSTTGLVGNDQRVHTKLVLTNSTTVTQTNGLDQTNIGGYQVVEWY